MLIQGLAKWQKKAGYGTSLLAEDVIDQGIRTNEDFQIAQYGLLRTAREAAATDPGAAWEMFLYALRQQITGGAGWQGVQPLSLPTSAEWNNPLNGNYVAWRVLGDTISSWQPTYLPTAKQVTEGYKLFLTNLAIPAVDPADQAKVDAARTDYSDALDARDQLDLDLPIAWISFNTAQQSLPPNRRLSFDTWYAHSYGRRVGAAEDKVRETYQTYAGWMRRAAGGYDALADAGEAFNNDAYEQQTSIDRTQDSAKIKLRTYSITPDLNSFLAESRAIPQTAPPRLSFSLSRSSSRYSSSDSTWGGSVSFSLGFIGLGGGASSSRSTVDTSSNSFSFIFAARNVRVFTILPGQWFSGTIVQAFKNGPWVPNGPVASGRSPLWGPNGVFNLMPTQIVVVYQPTITMTLSQSEYSQVQTAFRAAGGFSIGPFGFGASYGRTTNDIHMNDASQTVTATDTSETPQIAAIVSTALPNFT